MSVMLPTEERRERLAPELDLLLCCARATTDLESAARLNRLAARGLDWARLRRLSHQHGLLPLVPRHLNAECPDVVPTAVLTQLREDCRSIASRNLHFTAELIRLLELFEENGIRAVPYKGPSLGAIVYGDVALSQFGDLDILVQRSD